MSTVSSSRKISAYIFMIVEQLCNVYLFGAGKNLFIWIVFIKIFLYMSQSQRRKCYKSFVSLGNSLRRNICNKQYLVYIYCWQQSRQRKFLSYETTCTAICSVIYWGHLGWHSWKNFCQYWHLPECIATKYKMHNVWSWEDFFLKKA